MKTIAIVIHNTWQGYNFRLNLARGLQKNGYKIVFISPFDAKYTPLIEKEFEFHDIYFDAKGVNPIRDIQTMFALHKIYKNVQPDLVLNFSIKANIYSSIVSGMMNIKSISNITGLGTIFVQENLLTKIATLLYKYALSFNSIIFFQNRDDKELFLSKKLVKLENTGLLPGSGVDLNKFEPKNKKSSDGKFTFLLIARLLRDKGIYEYIDAIKIVQKKFNDVEFQLLGAADFANKTAISKKQALQWVDEGLIDYLGVTDKVQEVIAQSDCVVLPSYYREGVPRSLLEACAMQKAIITTNAIGCREVIDDGINGYVCEVKSAKDLADKMEKMLNLSELEREKLGVAGREKMLREFDEKIVIEKYLLTIKNIFQEDSKA